MMKRLFYEVGRTLRETGTALDRAGLSAMDKPIFKEACESARLPIRRALHMNMERTVSACRESCCNGP
jgi:hypothetical protein